MNIKKVVNFAFLINYLKNVNYSIDLYFLDYLMNC